jgi:hypothetical protein
MALQTGMNLKKCLRNKAAWDIGPRNLSDRSRPFRCLIDMAK